MAVTRSVG